MKFEKPNYLFFLLFVLISCTTRQANKEKFPISKLTPFDTLRFSIDETTDFKALYPAYDFNNNSIWALNILNNRLYEYDIASKKSNFIQFDSNLDFGSIVGYNLIGKDSIAFLNKKNRLILSNREGKFLGSHLIKTSDIPGLPLLFPHRMEGIISSSETTLINNYNISNTAALGVKIQHENDQISPLGELPAEYIEGFYGYKSYTYFNVLVKDNEFIVNYPNLNEIFIYDIDLNLKKKVEINEKYRKNVIPIFPSKLSLVQLKTRPSEGEVNRIESQYLDNIIFQHLLYNPWRKEFYRIIGYPISEGLQNIKDPVKSFVREYSVMVFDEDFQVKGEYGLEYNKYLIETGSLIPVLEGLAIQVDSNEDEDSMVFDLFTFEGQ